MGTEKRHYMDKEQKDIEMRNMTTKIQSFATMSYIYKIYHIYIL